jgi:hypothetical protein
MKSKAFITLYKEINKFFFKKRVSDIDLNEEQDEEKIIEQRRQARKKFLIEVRT